MRKELIEEFANELQCAGDDEAAFDRVIKQYHEAYDMSDDEMQAASELVQAYYERQIERTRRNIQMLEEFPKGTTMIEAATIKAKQGDPWAQQYLDWRNSREQRLYCAMLEAAVDLHPRWERDGVTFRKLDDEAPEADELVEWLYKNHPQVARKIEAAVDAEAP
jgi:hypothetical protein